LGWGGRGSVGPKNVKAMYCRKLTDKWNFQRGKGEVVRKYPFGKGRMPWVFSGIGQCFTPS